MKKIVILIVCVFMVTGCESYTNAESTYTAQIKEESLAKVGLPNIVNFFEMSQLKEIYEMRDNPDLIMYWYTRNEMTGKWIYEGKCIGYGIPYGASITNPETYGGGTQSGYYTIDQAEPNGLYTNTVTSSATWVLSINEEGDIEPTYIEHEIRVSQSKISANLVEDFSIDDNY